MSEETHNESVAPTRRYKDPIPVKIEDILNSKPQPKAEYVVSGKEIDDVVLSSIVYKNNVSKKSLSVHHLQRRLTELGYAEASYDRDGYFSDGTLAAIEKFRTDKSINSTEKIDSETLLAIFDGDVAVRVVI